MDLVEHSNDVYVGKNTLKSMMNVVVEDDAVTAFFGRKIKKLVYNPSIFHQLGISQNNKKTVVDFLVVSYCLKLEYAKVFWRYQGMMIIWMHSFILHQLNDAHRLHFSTKQILRTISTPNLQIFW